MLHFSTGRQTFYVGYLKFYAFLTGTKACIIAADLIDSDENLHCFTRLLSSCNIKISIVSQCRILVAVQYMNTLLFAFFLSTDKLLPLDCSMTWSLLTQTDADWTCWLTVDAPVWKHNTNLKLTQTAATPYTGRYTAFKQYTVGMPSSSLLTTPWAKLLPTRFQATAQSEQHWHSNADIEGFVCSKLKIINECTSCSNVP